ncbi:MAG: T9SS type A sorting domain-containing protein [Saprospiraceae bacterium]|nr:T9SS type A sorting domain-containing protein [Saprospiraceae bacterium]MDW8482905.1 choice-of-anchor J domain-containing protein [Saprospiraceae bacterium]
MKNLLSVIAVFVHVGSLCAQFQLLPDTLLVQRFEVDPTDTMLIFPLGNDLQWVNWDADRVPPQCALGMVPGAWYWESDLGDTTGLNSAFTSCSYLANPNVPNENWLITPPIFITDSQAVLTWRSLSLEGPGYLDGYKVLISTTSNAPYEGAFTDTIFVAAEMVRALVPGSLNPDDYIFSPGYVHANRYRDSAYFFLPNDTFPSNRGRMEPHAVSLSAYSRKRIYIAFLHDSRDDNTLQIDDIVVVQGISLNASHPAALEILRIYPNPTQGRAILFLPAVFRPTRLCVTNPVGRVVAVSAFQGYATDRVEVDLSALPVGMYWIFLDTERATFSARIVKM